MKKGILYYLEIYLLIISQDIKSKMQYRADFVISSIGMIITNISGFLSFWLIYNSFSTIGGWTYDEMLFLYGFTLVAITPAQLFFDNHWNLTRNVESGKFISYCFRPVNLFFYYTSEIFDIKGLSQLLVGIIILVISWRKLMLPVTLLAILILIIMIISASLVMCSILISAAATSFWVIQSHFILMFFYKFKDYSKYPVSIFNSLLKFVFTFIIPIGFIAYYPSLFFLQDKELSILTYLSPVFGVLFFVLAYKFWMMGACKYNGTGS